MTILPDGPQPINVAVVEIENGIVGAKKRNHLSSNPVMNRSVRRSFQHGTKSRIFTVSPLVHDDINQTSFTDRADIAVEVSTQAVAITIFPIGKVRSMYAARLWYAKQILSPHGCFCRSICIALPCPVLMRNVMSSCGLEFEVEWKRRTLSFASFRSFGKKIEIN